MVALILAKHGPVRHRSGAMAGKNILIFSDGTGQIGGLKPDQRLSNIYKMYRAMRPDSDSSISPQDQFAFYDPGLGTDEGGGFSLQRIRNILASAFGTGISENIIDCYEAILKAYEPGDRIFLFGFSRGAYTARCVANVLNLCGVPSHLADGTPLPRSGPRLRKVAAEAVYRVYEHGSGKDRKEYEAEREALAARFRARYGSEGKGLDGESQGNVAPIFIGVFDTVAALGSVLVRRILIGTFIGSILLALLAYQIWEWLALVALIPVGVIGWTLLRAVRRQFKYISSPPGGGSFSWHFAAWNLRHYDRYLDNKVGYSRHAISIDENRERFPRVPWVRFEDAERMKDQVPKWIDQYWFAGNHSDIGGSYPEDESRLSDIPLGWMLEELAAIPDPPLFIAERLRVSPDPLGLQHDEVRSSVDAWPLGFHWNEEIRDIKPIARLHPSVMARLQAPTVPGYDKIAPYRPEGLRGHEKAASFYEGVPVAPKVPRMRIFARIAALLLLIVAAAHFVRIVADIDVVVAGQAIPIWVSWIAFLVPGALGVMLWREAGR